MEKRKIDRKNLQKVVERIGWEDIKTLHETERKKKRNGAIFMILGSALPLIVIAVFFFFLEFSFLQLIGIFFFSSLISAGLVKYGFSLFLYESERVFSPAGGKYTVFNQVKCTKCEYTETRPFTPKSYVGKRLDEECPKCQSSLRISGIFAEPEHEIETVGMPVLLQGGGGSMNLFDRFLLALDKVFPISTVLMKFFRKLPRQED